MSDLYKRIEDLCKEKGVTITEMCRVSGAPRGSLSDLKAGKTTRLNTATLSKITKYFGVSVDYLLGNEKKPAIQMDDELRGLGYEKLTPVNQEMVRSLIEHLIKTQSGS